MLQGARILVVAIILASGPGQAADVDGDGLDDSIDNCVKVANETQCDTDKDGFGNACDGDYNQDGLVGPFPGGSDNAIFVADFAASFDSGVGTDSDCNGLVDSGDFDEFLAQVALQYPGPSGLLCAGFEPCVDADNDGVANDVDNCTGIANSTQCDTDLDGYGNQCDGDFDQTGAVDATDFVQYFLPDFGATEDSGVGTNMNCDENDVVDATDFVDFFLPQFTSTTPGLSGLGCAGSVPCAGDTGVSQEIVFTDSDMGPSALRAKTDSQGRIHGIYQIGDGANYFLNYFTQSSPTVAPTVQTIASASSGDSIGADNADLALNSFDEPCVIWRNVPAESTNEALLAETFYGCLESGGLVFEDISHVIKPQTSQLRLELNSDDRPHITHYQHAFQGDPVDHSVWHVWRDGNGTWQRDFVPRPVIYQGPTAADTVIQGACLAIDGSNRVHIAMGLSYDQGLGAPPADFLGALVLGVWDPANPASPWEETEIIRADIGGTASPTEMIDPAGCEIAVAAGGSADVVYNVRDTNGQTSFHGHEDSTGWTYTALATVTGRQRVGGVATDAAGNVFTSLRSGTAGQEEVHLVRANAQGAPTTWAFDVYSAVEGGSGISAGNPASGETTCRVLYPRSSSVSQFILTTIEDCAAP